MPYDMTSGLRHRQFNPLFVLRKGALFMQEAAHTISRRTLGDAAATDVWLQSKLYPDYFMNTFHFRAFVRPAVCCLEADRGTWLLCSSAEVTVERALVHN